MIPAWLLDILAAVMLVVAAVSAARLVAARPWPGGSGATPAYVDIAHLLMAIAMAGMLAASLQTLPDGAWEVIFGLMTAWFAYRVLRDARVSGLRALAGGHCAPHLIHAASMLYMFLALTAPRRAARAAWPGWPARVPVRPAPWSFRRSRSSSRSCWSATTSGTWTSSPARASADTTAWRQPGWPR